MARGGTAIDAVRLVFENVAVGLDQAGRVEFCPLNNLTLELALGDTDFRDPVRPTFELWQYAIAERARRAQLAGASPTLDPDAFATHGVATCLGAMAMGKATKSSEAIRSIALQLDRTYRVGPS